MNNMSAKQYATSASQFKPAEAVLKLPSADHSNAIKAEKHNSTHNRNIDGAKPEHVTHKLLEIMYYQLSCSLLYLSNMGQVSKQLSTFGGRKSKDASQAKPSYTRYL